MQNNSRPLIIAETAYHHEGDISYLYKMIDEIAEMGMDTVKFHLLLNPGSYMAKSHPLIEKMKSWLFDRGQWDDIIARSTEKGLDVVALCDDVESLEYINNNHGSIWAIELHATGLNDWFLLGAAAEFDGTVILGVGGSTIDETAYAVDFLKRRGKNEIMLMYGFQNYPTDYTNINLSKMLKIRDLFELPVGYADHTAFDDANNEIISVMAAMMGINILEKHYTPNHGQERIDFQAAVGRDKMLRIKELMELAVTVYGDGGLAMSRQELEYGSTGPMKKAVVAKRDIKSGERLSIENLWFKRTEKESPVRQNQFSELIGLEAVEDIKEDEIVDFRKLKYQYGKADLRDFGLAKKV
ncbi:MAG: N-acetylneuraminate synthase family protein [Planctomycetota bacterium]|jgi:sialic acid synthase SpsE